MSLFSVTVVAAALLSGANPQEVSSPAGTQGRVSFNQNGQASFVPPGVASVGSSVPDAPASYSLVSCSVVSDCATTHCTTPPEACCAVPTGCGDRCVSATSCAVVPASVCNSGVCSDGRGGYMSASAWEQCCEECYGEDDCCHHRCITKYCVGPGDLHPHYPYFPAYHGYYYFRPYNWTHLEEARAFAAQTGGDSRAPYNTDHLRGMFANAPVVAPNVMPTGAFEDGLPQLESILDAANTEAAPAPKDSGANPQLTPPPPPAKLPGYDN